MLWTSLETLQNFLDATLLAFFWTLCWSFLSIVHNGVAFENQLTANLSRVTAEALRARWRSSWTYMRCKVWCLFSFRYSEAHNMPSKTKCPGEPSVLWQRSTKHCKNHMKTDKHLKTHWQNADFKHGSCDGPSKNVANIIKWMISVGSKAASQEKGENHSSGKPSGGMFLLDLYNTYTCNVKCKMYAGAGFGFLSSTQGCSRWVEAG